MLTLAISIALLPLEAPAMAPLPATFVHLFEWSWRDVGPECERLGREFPGLGVLISSQAEHAEYSARPWYERYQPVSYRLVSRSGTREELAEALARCRRAQVPVLVDAVINHMAALPQRHETRQGIGGTPYRRYSFPGLFGTDDFHRCGRNDEDRLRDYQDRWEVQHCNLLGLADLDTSSTNVRRHVRRYLQDLLNLGATGFRIDAAKHIQAPHLAAMLAELSPEPAVFSEVMDYGDDPIAESEYFDIGWVTDFQLSASLNTVLRNPNGNYGLGAFVRAPPSALPANRRLAFIDNHDLQREPGRSVTFRERRLFELAHVFLLAWSTSPVQIPSSFAFTDNSQSVPTTPACGSGWICEHRWPWIEAMLRLRQEAGAEPLTKVWTEGEDRVAFGRGGRAYVALNNSDTPFGRVFETALPEGFYCDVLNDPRCSRETAIRVDNQGRFSASMGPRSALALRLGARL